MAGILDAIFGAPSEEVQRMFTARIPFSDPARGLPDIGWLNAGFRPSANTIAGAEYDAAAPGAAEDAREVAARALAARMRRQTPTAPPAIGGTENAGMAWPASGSSPAISLPTPLSLSGPIPAQAPGMDEASSAMRPEDVPMPRPRPESVPSGPMITPGLERPDALPPGAEPTSGPALPAAAPAQPGFLERLGNGITNNAPLLMALGAGFAGAPSFGTGMQRALTMAGPVAGQNQTVNALVAKGMPIDMARAAASNPDILKQLIPSMFGPKQLEFKEIGQDMLGVKKYGFIDPVRGIVYDLQGKPLTGGTGTSSAPASASGGAMTLDNFDMSKVDSNRKGWDYAKQYPQEIQAAAEAYMRGDAVPTGNQRNTNISTIAKTVAQKVAMDLGTPNLADDTMYPARREMRVQLSRATPASLGGQLNFAGTSLGHLAEVAEKAGHLDNSSGFGIAPLASVINKVRGMSTEQASKVNDLSAAVQHYGQEITKFYAGSPGGEAERNRFLQTISAAKSPQEIAGAIRSERDLIPSRLEQIKGQIETTLGPEEAERSIKRAGLDKVIPKINAAIAKLDPDGPEAKMLKPAAAPSGGGLPSGWSVRVH